MWARGVDIQIVLIFVEYNLCSVHSPSSRLHLGLLRTERLLEMALCGDVAGPKRAKPIAAIEKRKGDSGTEHVDASSSLQELEVCSDDRQGSRRRLVREFSWTLRGRGWSSYIHTVALDFTSLALHLSVEFVRRLEAL